MSDNKPLEIPVKQLTELAKKVRDDCLKEIKATTRAEVEDLLGKKLPDMQITIQTNVNIETAKILKIPAEIVNKLPLIEKDMGEKEKGILGKIEGYNTKIALIEDSLKKIDHTKEVPINYEKLQKKLNTYFVLGMAVGAFIGYLFGLVWMLWGRAIP